MCIALFLACKSVAFYKIPFIKQQGKQYVWLVVKNHSAKQTDGELENLRCPKVTGGYWRVDGCRLSMNSSKAFVFFVVSRSCRVYSVFFVDDCEEN